MSLSLSLNNALSGLNINQQSLSVLSQNIANANTQGYVRKTVNQTAVYLDGRGAGVSLDNIGRRVDEYLLRSMRLQQAVIGRSTVASDYADRTQLLLGKPGGQNSLPNFISTFFNSMQALAQTPENSTLRVNVVNNAGTLAREVRTLAQSMQDMRLQAENEIVESINIINRDLRDLKALNDTITNDSVLGKNVGELLDRRDRTLRELSSYLDVSTYLTANNAINVFTGSGVSLLDDNAYQLSYSPVSSTSAFISNSTLAPINVYRINDNGELVGNPTQLVSGGTSAQVTSGLVGGKLRGLLDMRDKQIPNLLEQLDRLSSNMRDEFNRVHNLGIGFPGANSYTGARAVNSQDFSAWNGKVRIGVMDNNGRPIASPYNDETSGVRPLLMDLSKLNTGGGAGFPTIQGIIDEINQYYGPPQNKAVVGNLNNIRLASDSASLPGSPPQFSFDFDLENISSRNTEFFVTGMQVLDSSGADITSITQNVPQIALASTGTYVTTAGSNVVTVNTAAAHGLVEGQRIYLSTPGSAVDGIPAAQLGGFFNVTNVTSTGFDIEVGTDASAGGSQNVASQTAMARYREVEAGEYGRTTDQGAITASLSGNSTSLYYTIKVNVAVEGDDGSMVTSQLTYQVDNSQSNLRNRRYSVNNVTGSGTMVAPSINQSIARAILVDADGNELPKINGQYSALQNGYLKIVATNSNNSIGIDSLDSMELGKPNSDPAVAGTNRSFSHFFELNNFFKRYDVNGDAVTNSALNFSLEDRLLANPNLVSLGRLTRSNQPVDPDADPLYTYERNVGDNSIIQQLTAISSTVLSFASAGGLGQTSTTIGSYASAIIGVSSSNAASTQADSKNAQALMDGYSDRSDSISGVNLDEELANTVIYQNAYTASTRVISVVNELFDVLLNTFGR